MATIPWWVVAVWVILGLVALVFVVRFWVSDFGEMIIGQFLVWSMTCVVGGPLVFVILLIVQPAGFFSRPLFRNRKSPPDAS